MGNLLVMPLTVPQDAPIQDVVLQFYWETGKYIYNKPLQGSQKAKRLDSSLLDVIMKLKINYELERLILSNADSVDVIAPNELRRSIGQRLEKANLIYQKGIQ